MRTTREADTRDIARGAGVNYVGYIARLGSRVPFMFLAGLLYGEARFGVYTFALAIVGAAAALGTVGIKRSLFKFMSDEMAEGGRAYRSIRAGVTLAMSIGLIVGTVVALTSRPLASVFGLDSAGLPLLIMSAAIPLNVASDILLVTLRFTRQMRFDLYARSIAEPLTLTVAILILYLAGVREVGLAIGYVTSMGVAAALSVVFFLRTFSIRGLLASRPTGAEFRRIVSFSAPTAGHDLLLLFADRIDVLLVSYLMPASSVGIYGMAKQFATPARKLRVGFDWIVQPVVSDSLASGDRDRAAHQIALVGRWILTLEVALVLFFAFWGDDFLGLMRGEFASGALALVLLVAAELVNGALGLSELPLVYLRPIVKPIVGAVMLILAFVLNAALIPVLGLAGAGLATLLTLSCVNGLRVFLDQRLFGMRCVSPRVWKPFVAAVPTVPIVLAVQRFVADSLPFSMIVGVPVLITTYLFTLYALGLEDEDRDIVDRVRGALRGARRKG